MSDMDRIIRMLTLMLLVWAVWALLQVSRVLALTVAWDDNPVSDQVTVYEVSVVEVFGMAASVYPTSQARLSLSGLQAGRTYLVTVRAKNSAGLWSDPSDALTVIPHIRRIFEHSPDLIHWTVIKTDTGPEPAGFMRVRTSPP